MNEHLHALACELVCACGIEREDKRVGVCVCVCERERERERKRKRDHRDTHACEFFMNFLT